MNIVLLDDSPAHNAQMRRAIEDIAKRENLPAEVVLEATAFEELEAYAAGNPPKTLYFLDIRLETNETGIDACRALTRSDVHDRFVFVSAYPNYALDCLKVHAYDMLLKPVDLNALRECLICSCRDMAADDARSVELRIGSRIVRLPASDIYYVEAKGRNVEAHTARGEYSWGATLAGVLEMLRPYGFIQIHRSLIANRAHIPEMDTEADSVTVHGTVLPFSRRIRREMKRGAK